MSLQNVKTLLGIKDTSRDDLLELVIGMVRTQLLSRLIIGGEPLLEVPLELEYIVTELAVIRYNRIGSEGMSQESVEGHSANYRDDDWLAYDKVILAYLNRFISPKRGVVRFI